MKRYHLYLEDETFEVEILDDPRQPQVRVRVNGEAFTVDVQDAGNSDALPSSDPISAATPAQKAPTATARVVAAPLPGTIKSVSARPGAQVAVGDPLLVIEAMKMDNVIRAQRGGRIDTVHAIEGHQVAHGEPLVEFAE